MQMITSLFRDRKHIFAFLIITHMDIALYAQVVCIYSL